DARRRGGEHFASRVVEVDVDAFRGRRARDQDGLARPRPADVEHAAAVFRPGFPSCAETVNSSARLRWKSRACYTTKHDTASGRAMTMRIEIPTGRESLTEFVSFHDQVYGDRSAHWPVAIDLELPILLGDSPFNAGRRMRPFVASDQGAIVARALA